MAKLHREALAFGTAAIINAPVAATTVGVVTFSRYQPFGSASTLPVYDDEAPTTPLRRSKFIYQELIPAVASSCI